MNENGGGWLKLTGAPGAHMRGGDTQRCRVRFLISHHHATLWAVVGVVPPMQSTIKATRARKNRRAILVPSILRSSKIKRTQELQGSPSARDTAEFPPRTPPRDPGQGKRVVFGLGAKPQRNEVQTPAAQGWSRCSSRACDLWGCCAASGDDLEYAWAEQLLPRKTEKRWIRPSCM